METSHLTAENVGSIVENANVSGKNIAFRDVNIYKESRPTFSSPNLAAYDYTRYPSPKFTSEAYQQLLDNKILIVSRGAGFDKSSFIRHLAFLLTENQENFEIRELLQNEESLTLLKTLKNCKETSVFIIDQAHPKLFDYDIKKFKDLANSEGHYILVTTEVIEEVWGVSELLRNIYWFEIPEDDLYSKEVLTEFLIAGLSHDTETLPLSLSGSITKDSFLLSDKRIQDVAGRFDTPGQISFFLQLLKHKKEQVSHDQFEEIIQITIGDDESLVCKWYRNLEPREQIIALGVALLEGMYDDQFFRSMQDIVKDFWQYRDSFLLSLDYCDLTFLLPFFKMEDINEEKRLIRNRYPNQRTDIVYTAWNSYRRHILSALPLLIKMVEETISVNETDWEKYGTRDRRMMLRQAIGNTISDIGLVSFHIAESALLELASFQETTIQRVAAKAMARWREFGQEDLLFKTLFAWQRDERIEKLIENFQKSEKLVTYQGNSNSKALSYIKATALLSLGYAANYDSPNHLDQRIIDLLKEIASDNDQLVRSRLRETLPRIIHHHSLQLIETLEDFIVLDDLEEPIAEGLTRAYEDYPHELKKALFGWLQSAVQTTSNDNRRNKFTYRDKIIATILETYKRIYFTGTDEDIITVEEVLNQLVSLRQSEGRDSLQKIIIETGAHFIAEHFEVGAPFLMELYDRGNSHERIILLEQLTSIYIKQRKKQPFDYSVEINNECIPVWLESSPRPLTLVEEYMLQWVNDENIELKKLGSSAFLKFIHAIDYQEEIELTELRHQLSQRKLAKEKEERTVYQNNAQKPISNGRITSDTLPFYRIFPLWRRIQIFVFLLWKPKKQQWLFKELFKSIFFHQNYHPRYKWFLLRKLRLSTNPLMQEQVQWHQRFLR